MELKAKILYPLGIQSGTSKSGNPWQKAEIIVETLGQYPKKVKLSNMKEATAFSKLPPGYECTFLIDLQSNEYNGRWYTEVQCYKWEFPQTAQTQPQPQPYAHPAPQPQQTYTPPQSYGQQPQPQPQTTPQGDNEDLPF